MSIILLFFFLLRSPPNEISLNFTANNPKSGMLEVVDEIRLIGALQQFTQRSQDVSLLNNRKYLLHFKYMIPQGYSKGTIFQAHVKTYKSTQTSFEFLDTFKFDLKYTDSYWRDFYKVIKVDKDNFSLSVDFHVEHPDYYCDGDLYVKNASLKLIGRKFVENP